MLGRDAQDVYFDYDKNDIRADGRDTLSKDADLIKERTAPIEDFNTYYVTADGLTAERQLRLVEPLAASSHS